MLLLLVLIGVLAALPGCARETKFDGAKAFKLLEKQVAFGPRVPATPGHAACLGFMQSYMQKYSDEVSLQPFTRRIGRRVLSMTNLIAVRNPSAEKFVLLCAHWDTRPTADMEVDPVKKRQPIPGANDGASGVAVLMEIARLLAENKSKLGVIFVFFDGEDYGPTSDNMFMGSEWFADSLKGDKPPIDQSKIEYGILLDMVGDKDLKIYQEKASMRGAPEVVARVWSAAKKLGYEHVFVPQTKYFINDDHIPLLKAGVKCIDVIDFDYRPWHTLDDTPDKCSAESLGVVGSVVVEAIGGK